MTSEEFEGKIAGEIIKDFRGSLEELFQVSFWGVLKDHLKTAGRIYESRNHWKY